MYHLNWIFWFSDSSSLMNLYLRSKLQAHSISILLRIRSALFLFFLSFFDSESTLSYQQSIDSHFSTQINAFRIFKCCSFDERMLWRKEKRELPYEFLLFKIESRVFVSHSFISICVNENESMDLFNFLETVQVAWTCVSYETHSQIEPRIIWCVTALESKSFVESILLQIKNSNL